MTNTKKNICVMFGGKSPEHEVSVITGLQALKNLDREKYNPIPLYISKENKWYVGDALFDISTYKNLSNIPLTCSEVFFKSFSNADNSGSTKLIYTSKKLFLFEQTLDVDLFFPCFHGSYGEKGSLQGLFELNEVPFAMSGVLASALGMDKVLMKQVFDAMGVKSAPYLWFFRNDYSKDKSATVAKNRV
jgi:D-alanine-D-alanine ligase